MFRNTAQTCWFIDLFWQFHTFQSIYNYFFNHTRACHGTKNVCKYQFFKIFVRPGFMTPYLDLWETKKINFYKNDLPAEGTSCRSKELSKCPKASLKVRKLSHRPQRFWESKLISSLLSFFFKYWFIFYLYWQFHTFQCIYSYFYNPTRSDDILGLSWNKKCLQISVFQNIR